MIFYLPLSPRAYGEAFTLETEKGKTFKRHIIYDRIEGSVVTPKEETKNWLSPENFIAIREHFGEKDMFVVDRFRGDVPVVQIVDHRNLSGKNSLTGKTPIGNRPRFPDLGKLYDRRKLGLQQVEVDCFGKERFYMEKRRKGIAETVAHVSLCAYYAGWKILAVGWCQELDGTGVELSRAMKDVL